VDLDELADVRGLAAAWHAGELAVPASWFPAGHEEAHHHRAMAARYRGQHPDHESVRP
jgi:hypothetical protein